MSAIHQQTDYLLIGAGCFGASTALQLKPSFPERSVTLIDRSPFPCPSAASHDLNKVIRAEYVDKEYMKLALEAQSLWKSDPIFKSYYHETGILFAGIPGPGFAIAENYKALTGSSPVVLMTPRDAKERFDGIFRDSAGEADGVTECVYNPNAGWGEAEKALRSVIQAAVDLGVEYVETTVSKVNFDKDGSCIGAQAIDGTTISASHTLLCTGAKTAELLASSAAERPEIQVEGRMTAAAAIMCAFKVPENQMPKFSNAPIIISPMGACPGESIPPDQLGLVKCTHELSFMNNVYHELSKKTISVPPKRDSQSSWSQDVPQGLKNEVELVRENLYGKWVEGLKPEYYKMCWDAVTPNGDFIISPHPNAQNLYVASGGSFHSWKFLPNIGKYVTQMLHGELESVLVEKWAWDRGAGGGIMGMYDPTRDLKDIEGYDEIK